jgi:hypothetical protein
MPLVVVTSTLLPGVAEAISDFTAAVIWLSEAAGSVLVAVGPAPVAASCPVCVAACGTSAVAPVAAGDAVSLDEAAGIGLFEALSAEATRVPEVPLLLRVLATCRSLPSLAEVLVVGGAGGVGATAAGAITGGAAGAALELGAV